MNAWSALYSTPVQSILKASVLSTSTHYSNIDKYLFYWREHFLLPTPFVAFDTMVSSSYLNQLIDGMVLLESDPPRPFDEVIDRHCKSLML
jgi:hypothetical protein